MDGPKLPYDFGYGNGDALGDGDLSCGGQTDYMNDNPPQDWHSGGGMLDNDGNGCGEDNECFDEEYTGKIIGSALGFGSDDLAGVG